MFCKYCGAQLEDGSAFCSKCGGNLAQPAAAQPQAAQPKPQKTVAAGDILELVKTNLHYILAGIAVLAFIWGILNVFSVFHIKGKVSFLGRSESQYVSVAESEGLSGIAMVYVGNIIFGLACLAIAAIGVLYFLKKFKNMPYYDQFIASKLKYRPAFMMGALGVVGALLQMIMYLFCGEKMYGMRASVSVNWTTWLLLVIFAIVAVADKFVLEAKEKAQLAQEQAAESFEAPGVEQ